MCGRHAGTSWGQRKSSVTLAAVSEAEGASPVPSGIRLKRGDLRQGRRKQPPFLETSCVVFQSAAWYNFVMTLTGGNTVCEPESRNVILWIL